ncbi:Cof-type HAD-IIB family hydrolase [Lapidilactobacillus wuchangensis]|uniref:Cof-type HAD-IIB family hydrolase n=1 Tax=Lapidilactobacillus wuchangensis TaxID=2486001 RepID=UPI0013DE2769|nr:Cof-type HAD-IIB family hydrolase [Lapidilactobacillus wuchangensis]
MKLVAVDIDGTFVNHHNEFDVPRFRRLFKKMQAQNIEFVVASGNQYPHCRRLFPEDLQNQINYVAENGALVTAHGKEVFCGGVSFDTVKRAIAELEKIPGTQYIISSKTHGYVPAKFMPEFHDEVVYYYAQYREYNDLNELKDLPLLKLTALVGKENVPAAVETFKNWPDLLVTSSGFGYLDMINPEMHKAAGLEKLSEYYGISPEDMVVFGDSGNDKEMFRYAGQAYAMANAEEQLKALTDLRAPSNEENGVLQVLDELLAD